LPRLARRRLDDHQRMAPARRHRGARGGATAHGLQLGDLLIDLGTIERVRPAREVSIVIEERLVDRAHLAVALGDVEEQARVSLHFVRTSKRRDGFFVTPEPIQAVADRAVRLHFGFLLARRGRGRLGGRSWRRRGARRRRSQGHDRAGSSRRLGRADGRRSDQQRQGRSSNQRERNQPKHPNPL
jgi:hypothetical protein